MLRTAAGPVQPHVGLAGRRLPGFFQYLQRRLIAMENFLPAELPVQHLVDGLQPGIRDIQQPVGHGLPGELQSLAVKLLLQPVQRGIHHKLLYRNMRYRLRGSIAAGQQRRLLRCFQDVGFAALQFAVFAGVGIVDIFPDPEPGRFHLQAPADLFADLLHLAAAAGADDFFIGQSVFHNFGRCALRDDLGHTARLFLARMGFYGNLFRSSGSGAIFR